ncbi:MAG: 3-deoxy-manno-octulosonate cytidylyltransferase [Pseudomonadota bacterium]|nr:3-deoxy-manno-octulosonate cytidylyltransferase [Pseudomonadota bacterium]
MPFSVIIPARYNASRLPGKPLLDLAGKSMLQRTYENAKESTAQDVYIATDDERIKKVSESFGAKVFMTSINHKSGTDRIQEVAAKLKLSEDQIIVNVQADEPLLPSTVIDQVFRNLNKRPEAGMATVCEVITVQSEIEDPHAVKVVIDDEGYALYFSRATIPYQASASARNCYRHIGIYAYRLAVLNQFVEWPAADLEVSEKLEQLRALSKGVKVHVEVSAEHVPVGIDTERDLQAVRNYLATK